MVVKKHKNWRDRRLKQGFYDNSLRIKKTAN